MDINALNANLNRDKWGVRNFRALKSLLVKEVQESLSAVSYTHLTLPTT